MPGWVRARAPVPPRPELPSHLLVRPAIVGRYHATIHSGESEFARVQPKKQSTGEAPAPVSYHLLFDKFSQDSRALPGPARAPGFADTSSGRFDAAKCR